MKDRYQVFGLVEQLRELSQGQVTIVSGGCRKGADSFAEEAAKAYKVSMAIWPVNTSEGIQGRWDYAQKAYERNLKIVEDCDEVWAWVSSDRTGGTENTIGHALNLGKKIFLVDEKGNAYLSKDGTFPECEPVLHL